MTMPPITHRVAVSVATGWASPQSPRDLDEPAVRDRPDIAAWTAAMDAEDRMGLHGRTLTQLLLGEPVVAVDVDGDWTRVVAPWQPDPSDERGYPCWVRTAHLEPADGTAGEPGRHGERDRLAVLETARTHLGLQYLWGGMCADGLDCSGLVHHSYRTHGIVVPRDAHPQYLACEAVRLGDEQPGDLYFFARDGGEMYHVGFVTGRLWMLHAPETGGGGLIEDVELPAERRENLVAAGRVRL